MKFKWKLIFFVMLVSSFVSANEKNYTNYELSIQDILENSTNCIKEVKENKIYLMTDCISISDRGIYILLDKSGKYVSIPQLCTDEEGCFILVDLGFRDNYMMNNDAANNYKGVCPGCGLKYFVFCRNPNCALKKNR